MTRGSSCVTSTPRRNYGSLPSSKSKTQEFENEFRTPVRTPKRKRNCNVGPVYTDSVEDEFYRIFSDSTKRVKHNKEDDLSFLFRGPTNHIGTSTVGMYGEIAHSSLKQVCKKMIQFGLDDKSVVLDLGSGRGVPNFVFASDANPFSSIGIEKCPIAYLNSINNVYISLSRDIKRIHTSVQQDQDKQNGLEQLDLSPVGSKAELIATPSTVVSVEEQYDFSVNTQLEEDEQTFNEESETPLRHLRTPKLPHEIEIDKFQRGLEEFKTRTPRLPVAFVNEDIIAYDSFEGVTHFYSFDIAMERALINNMVYQFKNTSTAYVFASFISDLITSFELTDCFVGAKVPCKMYGSGEGKQCYVYVKNDWKKIKARSDAALEKLFGSANTSSTSTKSKPKNEDEDPTILSVNNYDEPYSSLDIIKLSKMPLYHQYMWYLRRLGTFYRPLATRSRSRAATVREHLAAERDLLIEQIAHFGGRASQELRRKLRRHIATNYRITGSFPN